MTTYTNSVGSMGGIAGRDYSLDIPEGQIFKITGSKSTEPTGYGIMQGGQIKEINLSQMLGDMQAKWESAIKSIPIAGRGNLLADIQAGKVTSLDTPEGKITVRAQPDSKGVKYLVTTPDGKEVEAWSGGGSQNVILGQIVKKGLGIDENISIGYNIDPTNEANMRALEKEYGFAGVPDDQLNTYVRSDLQGFVKFSDQPLTAQEAVSAIQATPKADQYGSLQFSKETVGKDGVATFKDLPPQVSGNGDKNLAAGVASILSSNVLTKGGANVSTEFSKTGDRTPPTILPKGSTEFSKTGDRQPPTIYPKSSDAAVSLVDQVLRTNSINNLQQYDWWNSSPVKNEAWELLQRVMNSPDQLAQFVKQQGYTDLQQYDWWKNNPYKVEAWNKISAMSDQSQQYQMGYDPNTTANPAGGYDNPTNQPQEMGSPWQEAFDYIDGLDWLSADQKAFYKQVVSEWDPDSEINVENVLNKFKQIKNETIDPYYQNLADQMIGDVTRAKDYSVQEREMQMEQERLQSGQATRQMKEGLEKAGMTFTGKAIEELGKDAAYAQTTGNTSIPTQQATEGMFYEGNVNQANRLMSTSNQARYMKNMAELAAAAEKSLGSGQASLMAIPGAALTGGVTGQLEEQKQQELASTLSSLAGQQNVNTTASTPITI